MHIARTQFDCMGAFNWTVFDRGQHCMTAGVRTRSTAYRRLDLAVYCWTLVKPRPQKRGLYAMVVSRSSVRLFVCSSVCRLQRELLLPAGAYRVGHSGCSWLRRTRGTRTKTYVFIYLFVCGKNKVPGSRTCDGKRPTVPCVVRALISWWELPDWSRWRLATSDVGRQQSTR